MQFLATVHHSSYLAIH